GSRPRSAWRMPGMQCAWPRCCRLSASTPPCPPAWTRAPCWHACAWTRKRQPAACVSSSGMVRAARGSSRKSRNRRYWTSYNRRPMRLLLQQRPDGREAPRFVQLMLERDLLGGWTLVRESGQSGGRSTVRREQFLEQAAAMAAFERARDLQLKKGFQLMFAQGVDAPK